MNILKGPWAVVKLFLYGPKLEAHEKNILKDLIAIILTGVGFILFLIGILMIAPVSFVRLILWNVDPFVSPEVPDKGFWIMLSGLILMGLAYVLLEKPSKLKRIWEKSYLGVLSRNIHRKLQSPFQDKIK